MVEILQDVRSWFSGGTIVVGQLLLVVEYVLIDPGKFNRNTGQYGAVVGTSLKFPGGSRKLERGDYTPLETLQSEWREEVFRDGVGELLDPSHIITNVTGDGHEKHFFLATKYRGALRTRWIEETPNRFGIIERLGPPQLISPVDLLYKIHKNHQSPLLAFAQYLGNRAEEWGWISRKLKQLAA